MEEPEIVVDVEATPLSESMQRKLHTLWGNTNKAKNCTIFRIPHMISQSKKNLFEPSVISIGPFHRGKKSLQILEEQKWQFLQVFLSRRDHISLNLCISEMKLLELRTRRCYSETFDDLDSNAFVEMMLLDGCFVLEYFLNLYRGLNSSFEVGWNSNFIQRDLVLLENQIPFFIVNKLCELIGFNQEFRIHLIKFIARTFFHQGQSKVIHNLDEIPDPPAEIHHLVHLCYHYLVPNPEKLVVLSSKSFDLTTMFSSNRIIKGLLHPEKPVLLSFNSKLNSTSNISSMVIPSASELKKKGLKLTPKRNPRHMLDISFVYGVLQIPRVTITAENKPILANLVAFENSEYGKMDSPFTKFVAFLENLVKTQNDVKILQQCGIIENWLGSEKEVTDFIDQFTEGNVIERDHYFAELYVEVNRYIEINWDNSSWNRLWAELNKRKAISLTAFIALVLTLVQSFFAVYAYYYPPRS